MKQRTPVRQQRRCRTACRQSDCGHFVEKGFCIFHCQPRLTAVKNVRNGFGCGRNLPARAAKPRDTKSDCGHFVEKGFCIFHCQPRLTAVKNVRNGFGCGRNLPARAAKPRDTNASQRDCGPSDTSQGTLLMVWSGQFRKRAACLLGCMVLFGGNWAQKREIVLASDGGFCYNVFCRKWKESAADDPGYCL